MQNRPNPSSTTATLERSVSGHSDDQSYRIGAEETSSLGGPGSVEGGSASHISGSEDDYSTDAIARRENKAISSAKLFVLFFLLSLAVIVAYFWYGFTEKNQRVTYQEEFKENAGRLIETFYKRLDYNVLTAASLASQLTSSSRSSTENWPYVSFPNFERRTAGHRRLTSATAVWFSPLLSDSERPAWESYALDNQGMLESDFTDPFRAEESLMHGNADTDRDHSPYRDVSWNIQDGIYRIKDDKAVSQATQSGELRFDYAPIWQSAPYSITHSTTMFNQMAEEDRKVFIRHSTNIKSGVLSKTQWEADENSLLQRYQDGLHVSLYTPIFESLQQRPQKPVGSLTFDLNWVSFWSQSLQGVAAPLVLLVENTCNQTFMYIVGDDVTEYVPNWDKSVWDSSQTLTESSTYEAFAQIMNYNMTLLNSSSEQPVCLYKIKIYPTDEFRDKYLTNIPTMSSMGVGGIFILTAAVFIFYDCLVERRQARVMQSAKRTNAIVRSLFPAGFRDRLMVDGKGKKSGMADILPENYLPMETPKLRLKSFLTDAPRESGDTFSASKNGASNPLGSEPIADFFPNTTVLFADLSGFSAWSSTREPSQVFTLLETLYGAMDKAARKLGVFKVETVGDCYVAATGLPDPRDDHAVLMVRFANTCLQRINELTSALEAALGPGTGDLAMRFGIHSGPVTAGVLRGEKSRFQLFGDTMNTAARMEHTGLPNKVHLSKETAELVIAAGRAQWVEPREEVVTAKGKGELQTYWLRPPSPKRASTSSLRTDPESTDQAPSTSSHEDEFHSEKMTLRSSTKSSSTPKPRTRVSKVGWANSGGDLNQRKDRLVDWNVEILTNLLKKIVARRNVVKSNATTEAISPADGTIVLDEIKEVVELPDFNPEVAVMMAADSKVELDPKVRTELKDYVYRIASFYHDNPFHNFEHASHVALSAHKLLKRIVMPDGVDYRRDSQEKEIEKIKAIAQDLHVHTYGISSDPVTQFAVVFSALIHDTGHTGVPNGQLAKEEPETANKYRNKCIAEQRSVDVAWDVLMEPQYENLRGCMFPTQFELKHFRQLIVNSVMATDIFDKELSALRKSRWQKVFHPDEELKACDTYLQDAFHRKATIVIEHIIQASDVAHTMQHWHVYQKWNEKLFQEMYAAFRAGRSEKDPSQGWYQGELWFFDNYVIPLAHKLKECGVFGVSSAEYLNYALENRDEWERKGNEVCENMIARFDECRFA